MCLYIIPSARSRVRWLGVDEYDMTNMGTVRRETAPRPKETNTCTFNIIITSSAQHQLFVHLNPVFYGLSSDGLRVC